MRNYRIYIPDEKEKINEHCGVFAIYVNKPRVLFSELLYGGIGIQNRGQNGAGMVVGGIGCPYERWTQDGLIKDIFVGSTALKFENIKNKWGMIQCRYGTNGSWCPENNQPCSIESIDGIKITVAHNGEFVGLEKYKDSPDISDTRIFTKLLANAEGKNWDDRVRNTLDKMEGSYSLVIGVNDILYIARDKYGIRPLLIAKVKDGWAIASESQSFENIRALLIREILPGEISKIDKNKINIIKKGNYKKESKCIFEFPYTRSPNSLYRDAEGVWKSIYEFRQKSGTYLAKQFRKKGLDIDFIVGIPESGLPAAEGFHNEFNKPINNVITRKPGQYYIDMPTRTFMSDKDMKNIPLAVGQKLSFIPDKNIYKGKRIVCVDDSVVRSSTAKIIVEKLLSLGAKSVDWVSGLPMVIDSCYLGISIRSKEELVAFQKHSDPIKIAKAIGARSTTFISPENIVRAANNGNYIKPKKGEDVFRVNGFCGGCLGGLYPVSKEGKSLF